ncbi:MAG: cell wall metabolism sensor histidine kinase WalK [Clostridia bacterium]|nr:cell wall metabolism sensor histidine kinase WalK [Clostridia bacterium]
MVITYLLIIAMTATMIIWYTTHSMSDYLISQKKRDVLTQANVISGYVSQYQDLNTQTISYLLQQQQISSSSRVIMVNADAEIIYDSMSESSLAGKVMLKQLVLDALSGNNATQSEYSDEGELIVSAAVPITLEKSVTGAILLQSSAASINEYTSKMTKTIISLAILVAVLSAALALFLSGVITKPITRLTRSVVLMSENDTEEKLELSHGGEIGDLVESFNKLIDKLQLQEQKRQEFVSNASHELKTPLSSIKLISDSLIQNPDTPRETELEFLNDMNVQVDRLSRIIDKLLTLTRMDDSAAVSRMEFTVMDISELTENVVKALRPLAESKNIKLTYDADIGVFSRIEKDRLWEAIYNVLDNSIKYTPEGGSVKMTVERDEKCAVITVADTGIGMATSEIYKIFDRFYRVDKARSRETGGTGLGLSIAMTAVELHGGNIQVESREGAGSRFKITIPITLK